MSLPAETIAGSYSLVKMPDGSEVMMHRLDNGQWVTTAERAAQEDSAAFMASFTDFKLHEHQPATEGAIRPQTDAVGQHTATRNRIEAYLIEIMGEPKLIIMDDPLARAKVYKVRQRPQEMRHVLGLIDILNKAEWNMVKTLLVGGA